MYVKYGGPALACALMIAGLASGHGTDQFTVPAGKSFADFGGELNAHYYDAIAAGVEKLNERIRRAIEDKGDASKLERWLSPEALNEFVYEEFQPAMFAIESLEYKIHHSQETRDRYPGRITGHWEPLGNIYQGVYFPLDPRQFWRLWHAATMKVYGTYMGPDKVGHFNDMGWVYYLIYRNAKADGLSDEEAHERILAEAQNGLVLGERGFLGYVTAGAYSNADLVSNYVGFKFYLNLTRPTRIKGEMQPPMVQRDGEYWRLAPHVKRDSGFFAIFVSDHYNEALNPSLWEARARKTVRNSIRKRSERILEFYADENGNRRTKAYFDAKLDELSTYYGENYGHMGTYDELVAIGSTCFVEPDPDDPPKAGNANGYAALHWASLQGDTQRARDLLENGAAVDEPVRSVEIMSSEWGSTPLHIAAANGRTEMVELLVDHGADVNAANEAGATPLHKGIDTPAVVEILIARGADIDAADQSGRTPLHWLARYPTPASVNLLIEKGADVYAIDHAGLTSLHRAAESGHTEMIETLLAAGASLEATARFDTTVLHFAIRQDKVEVIDLLVDRGALVDATDDFGATPLHDVARRGRWAMVKVLLEHGADPNAADGYGSTPLHLAARHGMETATAVLIEAGANVNAANHGGSVPLHEAAFAGQISLVNLLVSNGADLSVQNTRGETVADLASAQGNTVTALMLSSLMAAQPSQTPLGIN